MAEISCNIHTKKTYRPLWEPVKFQISMPRTEILIQKYKTLVKFGINLLRLKLKCNVIASVDPHKNPIKITCRKFPTPLIIIWHQPSTPQITTSRLKEKPRAEPPSDRVKKLDSGKRQGYQLCSVLIEKTNQN